MGFSDAAMLLPLSTIYRAVTWTRLQAYKSGLLSTFKLPVPVISVGNLTTGGTGKTPLVEWVCRKLKNEGKRVCVLTRGYGRGEPKSQVVVSNGEKILADEREAGDEPSLLARNLLGIAAVICDPNRVAAGEWAIKNLGAEVFVLDDGFQHLRLARDLDIVTIDATAPWGGGSLLPRGRLREPSKGLSRADCVVLTRVDQVEDLPSIRKVVQELAGDSPIFMSRMIASGLVTLDGKTVDAPLQPIAAFCGVGNAESFFTHLRRECYQPIFTRAFADHHVYKQSDVDALVYEAKAREALSLITTAKDAIKVRSLNPSVPCYVFKIQIAIEEQDRFLQLIRNAISKAVN